VEFEANSNQSVRIPETFLIVEVISAQLLKFNTLGDFTVTNQDGTFADVSLTDGDQMILYSASTFLDKRLSLDDQMLSPTLVPGGALLILYGKTASGNLLQIMFFCMYEMNYVKDNGLVKLGETRLEESKW